MHWRRASAASAAASCVDGWGKGMTRQGQCDGTGAARHGASLVMYMGVDFRMLCDEERQQRWDEYV